MRRVLCVWFVLALALLRAAASDGPPPRPPVRIGCKPVPPEDLRTDLLRELSRVARRYSPRDTGCGKDAAQAARDGALALADQAPPEDAPAVADELEVLADALRYCGTRWSLPLHQRALSLRESASSSDPARIARLLAILAVDQDADDADRERASLARARALVDGLPDSDGCCLIRALWKLGAGLTAAEDRLAAIATYDRIRACYRFLPEQDLLNRHVSEDLEGAYSHLRDLVGLVRLWEQQAAIVAGARGPSVSVGHVMQVAPALLWLEQREECRVQALRAVRLLEEADAARLLKKPLREIDIPVSPLKRWDTRHLATLARTLRAVGERAAARRVHELALRPGPSWDRVPPSEQSPHLAGLALCCLEDHDAAGPALLEKALAAHPGFAGEGDQRPMYAYPYGRESHYDWGDEEEIAEALLLTGQVEQASRFQALAFPPLEHADHPRYLPAMAKEARRRAAAGDAAGAAEIRERIGDIRTRWAPVRTGRDGRPR